MKLFFKKMVQELAYRPFDIVHGEAAEDGPRDPDWKISQHYTDLFLLETEENKDLYVSVPEVKVRSGIQDIANDHTLLSGGSEKIELSFKELFEMSMKDHGLFLIISIHKDPELRHGGGL